MMPNNDVTSSAIEVRLTERKGRGVFALRAFAVGEVIERAPVVVLTQDETIALAPTKLFDYLFEWEEEGGAGAIALGFGSLYNHSYTPNALYEQQTDTLKIVFTALRRIEVGEEITINYNGDPQSETPVIFLHSGETEP